MITFKHPKTKEKFLRMNSLSVDGNSFAVQGNASPRVEVDDDRQSVEDDQQSVDSLWWLMSMELSDDENEASADKTGENAEKENAENVKK